MSIATMTGPSRNPLRRPLRFFQTPKGLMLLILAGLLAAAVPSTGGQDLRILATAALVASALDVMIVFGVSGDWEFPSGALLTGLFIGALVDPFERIEVVIVAAIVAILAKHVLRLGGSHVFNPAALALVVASLAFDSGQSWWGALPDLGVVGVVAVALPGFFIARRLNKLPMVVAFLGIYLLLFTATAIFGTPATVAEVFRAPDLHALLFFAFFMLDDPPTSPVRYRDQAIFGVLVAVVGYVVFIRFGVVYFLLAGLLAGNVAEAVRRAAVKHRRARRARPRSVPSEVSAEHRACAA